MERPYPYSLSDIDPEKNITSQDVLVQGMLSKENLLDILHNFTLFKEDPEKGVIKIVPRYHQFRAVKKIIKRLKEKKLPREKDGIIWHTQGSGKSLTMMFTVRAMYHDKELEDYKIVFVTDRKELEKQLSETSKSIGFTVHVADSIQKLKNLLKTNTPDLIMAIVHKFQERDLKTQFPVLNESEKILVMIDEAHRTQYKLLGANLRRALPNSIKIAYTGTPIEKTEITFGEYIDKYTIKQSVEDGVTVEIVYEGRAHVSEIKNEEELDKKFVDVFSEVSKDERKLIMGRYTWRAYLEHEKVIKAKAKDMIEHYITHVFPNHFKAQVVAVSRLAAIRYKKALEEALKEKIEELEKTGYNESDLEILKNLKIEVVISGLPNDPPEYHEFTNPNRHDITIKSFKLPFGKKENGVEGNVGIIVVKSMLITGFDAPIEQVLYLDDVLTDHNLLQAIARVNRVYKNKSKGFVVDYVGVLKNLRKALSIYADEDVELIDEVVRNKEKALDELRFIHGLINEFFKKYGIENWRENIDECIDLLVDEEVRDEFIYLVRAFNRAMDSVLPDPEALKYVTDLKILNFIKESARNRYRDGKLSIKDASKKIREIVEEFLISKGIDPKIPPLPLLSDEFLEKIKVKSAKERAQELQHAIIEYINIHIDEDPEFYERFSERLKKILEEYRNNWEILAKELEKLREVLKKGREAEETFGFDPKKEMPFFGLLKKEIYGKVPIEELDKDNIDFLVGLTKDMLEIIKREIKSVDFWENYTKQKRLKSYLISHFLDKLTRRDKKYGVNLIKEKVSEYMGISESPLFSRRNEIAQKLLELAYHIYGK